MSWEDADNKLHTEEISHCVTVIQQTQQGWQVRRAALLHLYDGNVHQHPSVNLESFAQFLKVNFPKKVRNYQEEVNTGLKMRYLGLESCYHSVQEFLPLRCFEIFTSNRLKSDTSGYGCSFDEKQAQRLKQAYEIALSLSKGAKPKRTHLEQARTQMCERYPDIPAFNKHSAYHNIKSERDKYKELYESQQIFIQKLLQNFQEVPELQQFAELHLPSDLVT
jgi:hypothetical protein